MSGDDDLDILSNKLDAVRLKALEQFADFIPLVRVHLTHPTEQSRADLDKRLRVSDDLFQEMAELEVEAIVCGGRHE